MISSAPLPGNDPKLLAALTEAGLPTDDIGEPDGFFFRFEQDGRLLGFGGFELYGEDALLRSVVVLQESRGTGAGRAVTEGMLREIGSAGGTRAYLLTTTAADFFRHLGFEVIDRVNAPSAILRTRQASSICSSAPMLFRAI